MKYLVISDIHGSSESCKIILDKHKQYNTDKIIVLGDILYHGPRNDLPNCYNPKQAILLLNSIANNIIAIKGNCDAEVDQMVLDFKIHDEYIINNILLTHGHHINYLKPISNKNIKFVLHGHTHIIRVDTINDITYINIGSITIPKENTARCFAIIDNNILSIYDIEDNLILTQNL